MKLTWYGVLALILSHSAEIAAEVITDGSLGGAAQSLPGPNYAIGQSLGQTQGGNVFHSFAQFNILTRESANFQVATDINNIFARVTGGTSSYIDGQISSQGYANLWLINPAGWMIGKNATLNLPGAFHLTTATDLNFKDGGHFAADPTQSSTLSIAEPIDYQFNQNTQATITLDQANLVVKENQDLSLVGGDIKMQDAHLIAPGGTILLGSNRGSGGKWRMDEQGLTPISGQQGQITIAHELSKTASLASPSLSVNAPPIANAITPKINTGKIQLVAEQINLQNALVSSLARNLSKFPGGSIELKGGDIELQYSRIETSTFGSQDAGDITITGRNLWLNSFNEIKGSGSNISSDSFRPINYDNQNYGNGGSISINLSGQLYLEARSTISARTLGSGSSGAIQLSSPIITLTQQSSITTDTFGSGNSGTISINSHDLSLAQGSFIQSSANLGSQGDAGYIRINSPNIDLNQSYVLSVTSKNTSGRPGTIAINSQADPATPPGNIILYQSPIGTSNLGRQGDGGNIEVKAGNLVMNGGYIQANSVSQGGNGGKINVNAERTLLSQEQLIVGGDVRLDTYANPTLNVIQAAAPQGESGQPNVSRVELNIAGQLAKIDADVVNNRPIADDPCSVNRDQEASSLIQSGDGGLPPNAGDPVSLPLQRHLKIKRPNNIPESQSTNTPAPLAPHCAKQARP